MQSPSVTQLAPDPQRFRSGPLEEEERDWSPGPWDTGDLVELLTLAEPDLNREYYRQLVERFGRELSDVRPALLAILDDQRCLLNAVAAAEGIHVTIEHVMAVWLSVGHSTRDVNTADWATLRTICRVLGVSGAVVLDEHHGRVARWGARLGAAVVRRVGSRYLAENELAAELDELDALLRDNNCLLNAIAEAKGMTLTFEQVVEIRMRLGSIGTMLVASPQALEIICDVLDIDGVVVHYPFPAPAEEWGSGDDPAIIRHTGFLHFVAGEAELAASNVSGSGGKGKERL